MHQYAEKTQTSNKISRNITFLLNRYKMTMADLSKETGILYMTISRIVNGQTADPKISNLIAIANALHVTVNHLIYGNFLAPELNKPTLIPVVSIKNIDNHLASLTAANVKSWLVSQSKNERKSPDGFTVAILGQDIASPLFPNECALVIGTNIELENGDYVLANINNTGPSVKKFHYDPPQNYLTSLSPNSSMYRMEKSTVILGVVIETIMSPLCINVIKD